MLTIVKDVLTIRKMVQALYAQTPPPTMSPPSSIMDIIEDLPSSSRLYTYNAILSPKLSLIWAFP